MKRLRLWIKELSLSQQLLTIIFGVIAVFFVFNMVFLSQSVDSFVEESMYDLLHRSQQQIKYYLLNDVSLDDATLYDANIINVVYHSGNAFSVVNNDEVLPGIIYSVSQNLTLVPMDTTVDFAYISNGEKYLYCITQIDSKTYLVSILTDASRMEYRSNLMNQVVNMNLIVMSAIFAMLMLWVSSLIHPLNQIRDYIDKVKMDQNASLSITRRDEIGKVATALVDMKGELERQTRIKEEMIQNISHDLKTPIATIKSYAESIKDGIYPYGSLEKSADVIIEHAGRLEKKVYSLILLNKMEYLKDNCEPGNTLEMIPIIEKVASSFSVIRPEIEMRLNLKDVKFHGEEEPWRILIENLVDNAMRYAVSYIEIKLTDAEVSVSNDGKQISEERIQKLFKPYEKGTDGKFGLGLSIVQRIASTYQYHCYAENLTNGVCFRVVDNSYNPFAKDEIKNEIVEDAFVEETGKGNDYDN